jgi:hypothetical protein
MFSQLAAAASSQGVTTLHAALLPRADVDVLHARIEIEPLAPARAA